MSKRSISSTWLALSHLTLITLYVNIIIVLILPFQYIWKESNQLGIVIKAWNRTQAFGFQAPISLF